MALALSARNAINGDLESARGLMRMLAHCLREGIPLPPPFPSFMAHMLALASMSDDAVRLVCGVKGKRGPKQGANRQRDSWVRLEFDRKRREGASYDDAVTEIAKAINRSADAVRSIVDPWIELRRQGDTLCALADNLIANGKPDRAGGFGS